MKITKSQLRQIIKEELGSEIADNPAGYAERLRRAIVEIEKVTLTARSPEMARIKKAVDEHLYPVLDYLKEAGDDEPAPQSPPYNPADYAEEREQRKAKAEERGALRKKYSQIRHKQ